MASKHLTCIECPNGCRLTLEVDNDHLISVSGNQCEKGEAYVKDEIENPQRILTSCVLAQGLALKMIPVRTSAPIPRSRIFDAMSAIKNVRVSKPVLVGESVCDDFLGLDVRLVATRDCKK